MSKHNSNNGALVAHLQATIVNKSLNSTTFRLT